MRPVLFLGKYTTVKYLQVEDGAWLGYFDCIIISLIFNLFSFVHDNHRMEDIRDVTSALVHATTRILAVGLLLILFFYICGVMFTELFKDLYANGVTDQDYFSRLDKTLFTLFQFTALWDWSVITRQVMVVYPWAWAPIITFILISSFTVLNLVIAVICDTVHKVHEKKVKAQIVFADFTMTDRSESYVNALEMKVEELTDLVENLRMTMTYSFTDELKH